MRKNVKRITAVIACITMAFGLLTGCGGSGGKDDSDSGKFEAGNFDEKVSFTLTGYNTQGGVDYNSDAFAQYIAKKFNVDINVINNETSESAARFNLQATSGILSDCSLWLDFSWGTYYEFINQELFEPLPENWEELWPNLAKMVEISGVKKYLEVDGRIYAIPHAIYGNMTQVKTATKHQAVYFRKDWAKQVGMESLGSDGTIKLSELRTYLEKVKQAGLIKNTTFGGEKGFMISAFSHAVGIQYGDWTKANGKYEWSPNLPEYKSMLRVMQEWDNAGLFDKDWYLNDKVYYKNLFVSSQIAAVIYDGDVGSMSTVTEGLVTESKKTLNDVGAAVVRAEDGTIYAEETGNYWLAHVFAPGIDGQKMSRVLDIMDWACTEEGEIAMKMGVPETDWAYTAEQSVKEINAVDRTQYPSQWAFFMMGYCGDDYQYSGKCPSINPYNAELATKLLKLREEQAKIFPQQIEMSLYTGKEKSNYASGVKTINLITQIVCNNLDIDAKVDEFVSKNKSLWEPYLNALNNVME